jgi:hypothetical protein
MEAAITEARVLDAASARARWREAFPVLGVAVQLSLAVLVVYAFRLESRVFFNVAVLLTGGFVVHALLPLRARLSFFVALSIAATVLAVGPGQALMLVAIGVGLVSLAHLPVPFPLRITLLLGAGLLLGLFRANVLPGAWLASGAWALLGSMFMFRLVLYVQALR